MAAIIGLARSLKIHVIAEGVETQAQLDHLQNLKWERSVRMRCDMVQGFLMSHPPQEQDVMPLLEVEAIHQLSEAV